MRGSGIFTGAFFPLCGFDVDRSEQVISEDGQGHQGSGALEVSGQDASAAHLTVYGATRVFCGTSSGTHHVGKCLHDLNGAVSAHIILEPRWKKRGLKTIFSCDVSHENGRPDMRRPFWLIY